MTPRKQSPRAAATTLVAVIAGLVTFFAQPTSPRAQDASPATGPLGFGIQGGIFDESGSVGPRPLFGALLRFRLTPSLGLEASGAVSWRDAATPTTGDVTIFTAPVFANLLFYLFPGTPGRPAPFSPYLAGGGGVIITRIDPDRGSSDTDYDIGGNVGGGLDIRLGTQTVFTVDARYLFVDRDSELETPGGGTRIDVSRRGYTVTGQLTFYF